MIRKLIVCFTLTGLFCAGNASAQSGRKILFIGDSITDGNWGDGGGAKPSAERNHWDQNHLFGSGYMYLCAAHYMGGYPEAGLAFFNRGISGNTLKDIAARWEEDVIALRPDVLSILVGVNDVIGHMRQLREGEASVFDLNEWESLYRSLLDRARVENPDLVIVLGTPFISDPDGLKGKLYHVRKRTVEECVAIVRRMAVDYGAVYLPYGEMFESLYAEYPEVGASHWLWDGIHPTAAGHERMARLWIEKAGQRLWE